MTDKATEFAVEVPGRGFLITHGVSAKVITDPEFHGIEDGDDAIAFLDRGRKFFRGLQMPEIADSLRLVSRVTTVTRSDWAPAEWSPATHGQVS